MKKAYPSSLRDGKKIIIDVSVEVWPPNATRYSIVYLIECKSKSQRKVTVGEIEAFHSKKEQIAHDNGKIVFVTNTEYQEGAFSVAKNLGFKIIAPNQTNELTVLLHNIRKVNKEIEYLKTNQFSYQNQRDVAKIIDCMFDGLSSHLRSRDERVMPSSNVSKLSKQDIEQITEGLNGEFRSGYPIRWLRFDTISWKAQLRDKYGLEIIDDIPLSRNGKSILGYFCAASNAIFIDRSLRNTYGYNYVLAHEFGHFTLHRKLNLNSKFYVLEDSKYSYFHDKSLLVNEKNWIEWQSNYFADTLMLPEYFLKTELIKYHFLEGIRNPGTIYVDKQRTNGDVMKASLEFLSERFTMPIGVVRNRLDSIGLILYEKPKSNHFTQFLSDWQREIVSNGYHS